MLRTISVELRKWRRTTFLLVTCGAAMMAPFLCYLMYLLRDGIATKAEILNNVMMYHLIFTGPLMATLVGAQMIAAEYQWDTWKVSLTAPHPRWRIYMAKWIVGMVWMVALSVLVGLGGMLIPLLINSTGTYSFWPWLASFALGGVGLSVMIPFYHLITLISRSFFFTSGVGIVATFAALLMLQSKYQLIHPISGNLILVSQLSGGDAISPLAVGSMPIWIGLQVALLVGSVLLSLVYVQRADYR